MTQQDVADLADAGLSSVRTLESGKSSPTLAVTLRILDALGLTLVALPIATADEVAVFEIRSADRTPSSR